MIINYNGMESFKIQSGSFVLAFNPVSKKSKNAKAIRFGADVSCVSMRHSDFNGVDQTDAKNKNLLAIDGPGEYEANNVFVRGFQTLANYDGKERINTIYTVKLDKINLGFLGALSSNGIDGELRENLNTIDILFIPIGGNDVLEPDVAYKMAVKLGAKVIIPMHYDKKSLERFLKESGDDKLKPIDKLTIKKSEIDSKEAEVIVLKT